MERYPEECELEKIKKWKIKGKSDIDEAFNYIESLWRYPEYFVRNGRRIEISTGGWSGNEDIISAMYDNFTLWSLTWESSSRGGHYVFIIHGVYYS